MEKIFACEECGQVYHTKPPEKCMRHSCNSVKFEEIKEEDVINMHDVSQYLWDILTKKVSVLFGF